MSIIDRSSLDNVIVDASIMFYIGCISQYEEGIKQFGKEGQKPSRLVVYLLDSSEDGLW